MTVRKPSVRHSGRLRQQPRWVWVVLGVLVLLVLLRALLPSLLKSQINQRLAELEGFQGRVDGVSLSLWRGAYQLQGLDLQRAHADELEPFLRAHTIDFSLSWSALLDGRILSEIRVDRAQVIYVPVAEEEEEEAADLDEPNWQDVITDLFPIEIAYLEIGRTEVQYRDLEADPPVELSLRELSVIATGLSNRHDPESDSELPAWIEANGTTIGGGNVALFVRAAPLASDPLFDLDLAIESVELRALNDYLEAYSNVTASEGTLDLFVEIAARDGAFEGYVKPLFNSASLGGPKQEEEDRGIGDRLWEGLLNGLVQLFENQPRDQLGSRVPISGEFGQTDVDLWDALGALLRHAFIEALSQSLEGLTLEETDVGEAEGEDSEEDSATDDETASDDEAKDDGDGSASESVGPEVRTASDRRGPQGSE